MSQQIKNVAIIGASGNLGPSILNELLKSPFNITVVSRQSSTATFPEGAKVAKTDYTPESLVEVLKGQDAVVSVIASISISEQKKIVDAAAAAGVKRFIPSEFGSNTASKEFLESVPLGNKREVVEYLISKEKDGLTWTGLISGPFFDWGLKVGFLGFDLASKTASIFDGGNTPVTTSTLAQIGKGVVATLQHADETANKYVYISSTTTTQRNILVAIEKLTGQTWTVKEVSTKDQSAAGWAKLKVGDYSVIPSLIQAGIFSDKGLGDHRKLLWNEKLGLTEEEPDHVIKATLNL